VPVDEAVDEIVRVIAERLIDAAPAAETAPAE
jgi:hypothetical protein